jgi:hypothetical protein
MDGESDMDSGYVLLACDRDLSAPIATLIMRHAYPAPNVGWYVHRFGYGSWRDPYRKDS